MKAGLWKVKMKNITKLFIVVSLLGLSICTSKALDPCITNIIFTPSTVTHAGCGAPDIHVVSSQDTWMPEINDHWSLIAFSSQGNTNVCVTGDGFYRIVFAYSSSGGCCEETKPLGTITWMKNGVTYTNNIVIPQYRLVGAVVVHNPGTDCDDATVDTCVIGPTCTSHGDDDE